MQPEPQNGQPRANAAGAEAIPCPNCHTMMPREMRFCRACGYRLGEGIEEYTETVRLNPKASTGGARPKQTGAPQPQATSNPNSGQQSDPFRAQEWGAMAMGAAQQATSAVGQATAFLDKRQQKRCGRRRMHWIFWVILSFVIMGVTFGGILTPFALRKRIINVQAPASSSKVGAEFDTADGGAFVTYINVPGGAFDQAGLLGGDVVISFDGKPVKSESDLVKILQATPIGKTVEVIFLRDGVTKTAQVTTISEAERVRLKDVYDDRAGGKGYIGEGTDIDRVIVPGMNIYGVRLNRISRNRPAYMSGLRDGDIVIAFDGLPMRTRRELEERIVRAIPDSTVKFTIIRNGQQMDIDVKIGIDD
jgi:membrane-associated protease RseP (regulator of RpoE activity)